MIAVLKNYSAAFNARNIRERIIIVVCVLAVIYFIWALSVNDSLSDRREALNLRYENISQEMVQLTAQEKVFAKALISNPNARKQREIVQLETRLQKLDKELQTLSVGLISAEMLPEVIRDALVQSSELQLLGMQALKPEPLELKQPVKLTDDLNQTEAPNVIQSVGIYQHGVTFRVRGQYFEILSYLKRLESSGWQFYWSELEYAVDRYPSGIVQLKAYTLSTDKGFISE